jgi:predicted nuclease of predicted toxin-antitoxin system
MRFKIDENLPAELAELLRVVGYDAATVVQEGLGGKKMRFFTIDVEARIASS